LGSDRKGQFGIRINQQWRIYFEWPEEDDRILEPADSAPAQTLIDRYRRGKSREALHLHVLAWNLNFQSPVSFQLSPEDHRERDELKRRTVLSTRRSIFSEAGSSVCELSAR
jgi:hypothetical protein